MSDLNYDELDPGIREVVKRLNEAGFDTTDSGDGVSKFLPYYDTDDSEGDAGKGSIDAPDDILRIAHVHMPMHTSYGGIVAAGNLLRLVESWGVKVEQAMIQLAYDPVNKSAILSLFNVNDEMLEGGDNDRSQD